MRSPRKTDGSKLPAAWEQGRWIKAGLPRQGWIRVAADRAEPRGGTCDRCRKAFTGPAHILRHHSYDGALRVDEQCSRELRVKPQQAEPKPLPRSRATKRLQWLARAWKRGGGFDGPLSLPADGYVTTVWPQESGWRFEIRPVGHAKVCQAGRGYPSDEAARLAAFDAITELLENKSPRPKSARKQALPDTGKAQAYRCVARACALAKTYSIDSTPDTVRLAAYALATDGAGLQEPALLALLGDARRAPDALRNYLRAAQATAAEL